MAYYIIYATKNDADAIRMWINDESDIAWISKVEERENTYHWRAVSAIDTLQEQTYALWNTKSGPLNIPSGDLNIPDAIVADPFTGWFQIMPHSGATAPWFGGNLPGPYFFCFAEAGREAPGTLARSEFNWPGDRYKSIGHAAHPDAKLWWNGLLFEHHGRVRRRESGLLWQLCFPTLSFKSIRGGIEM